MDGNGVNATSYLTQGRTRLTLVIAIAAVMSVLLVVAALTAPSRAYAAAGATVDLGTADSYSVLGGQTVTNTGPSVLGADLGVSPGSAVTGFPPGLVLGAIHAGDAQAASAESALTTAYNDAAGRAPDATSPPDLGGETLVPGVYKSPVAAQLTGTLTLDAQGDSSSVFIFQIGSTLITASNSTVSLINGAQACNVFFQVGSSATLGTGTTFVGTIMALTSISAQTGATVEGRALARNGAVTLDDNTFSAGTCAVTTPTPTVTPSPSGSPTVSESPTVSPTPSESATASESPTPTESATASESPTPSESATASESPTPTESATASQTPSATPTASESATATVSESSTESPSATGSATVTESELSTESELATSGSSSAGGTLASTGASGLTTLLGVGAVLFLALGGAMLAATRARSRPGRRH